MNDLSKLRKNIDTCDRQLVDALSKRFSLVKKIALYKKENKLKPLDSARWQKVVDKVMALSVKKKVSRALMKSIFDSVHQESLAIEKNIISKLERGEPSLKLVLKKNEKIAFLGPLGTYSHLAAKKIFKRDIFYKKYNLIPKNNISDVFDSVQKGEVAYGVVPVENSIEGIVKDTMHLFTLYKVLIVKKYFLPIDHSLLALNPVKISQIKKVKAHPQSFGQCQKWLKNNLPHALLEPTNSNVSGLSDLKINEAIIASKSIVLMYDLSVAALNISDNPGNTTMFYVIKRDDKKH